jgi:phosphohistidine phosphatase SixA
MQRRHSRAVLFLGFATAALLVGHGNAGTASADQDSGISAESLLPELRKGGYVLYLRHTRTEQDQADTDPLNLDNVKAQRQLSDEGRRQAKALGDAFRELKLPFDKVFCSRFQRTQETARLLNVGEVVPSTDVTEGGLVVSPRENARRAAALRALLAAAPAAGKNLLIVSHKPNLPDAAGKEFGDLIEGEVAVFQPMGNGTFKLVARVAPSETWTRWAK